MKRCINYSTEGVWVINTSKAGTLPSSITSLFTNHQSSTNKQLQTFNKFTPALASICVYNSLNNRMTHFLHKLSPNTCKERIKEEVVNHITIFLLHNTNDFLTKQKLLKILQPRISKSLTERSRSEPSHWQKTRILTSTWSTNSNWDFGRLKMWPLVPAANAWTGLAITPFAAFTSRKQQWAMKSETESSASSNAYYLRCAWYPHRLKLRRNSPTC